MRKPKTLEALLDKYPPFFVAAFAVERGKCRNFRPPDYSKFEPGADRFRFFNGGWRAKTKSAIAKDSGLTKKTIQRISRRISWDEIPVAQMFAFWKGCGFEIFSHRHKQRLNDWLKNGMKMDHLSTAQKVRFVAKVKLHQAYIGRKLTCVSIRDKQHAPPLAGAPSDPSI